MPESYGRIYLHFVWTTYAREPFLTPDVRDPFFACCRRTCEDLAVEVVALNAVDDHVHVLAKLPPALSPARLAQRLKGASCHLIRHVLGLKEFAWQEGYSVHSVSRWDVGRVGGYVEGQQEHHRAESAVIGALEPHEVKPVVRIRRAGETPASLRSSETIKAAG